MLVNALDLSSNTGYFITRCVPGPSKDHGRSVGIHVGRQIYESLRFRDPIGVVLAHVRPNADHLIPGLVFISSEPVLTSKPLVHDDGLPARRAITVRKIAASQYRRTDRSEVSRRNIQTEASAPSIGPPCQDGNATYSIRAAVRAMRVRPNPRPQGSDARKQGPLNLQACFGLRVLGYG